MASAKMASLFLEYTHAARPASDTGQSYTCTLGGVASLLTACSALALRAKVTGIQRNPLVGTKQFCLE